MRTSGRSGTFRTLKTCGHRKLNYARKYAGHATEGQLRLFVGCILA
jgi:hypothetical protein